MLDYDEEQRILKEIGGDYDLGAALEYNPQENLALTDIRKVLAVVEGVQDESDWHWLLSLKRGGYAYLTGGCDYTGWD